MRKLFQKARPFYENIIFVLLCKLSSLFGKIILKSDGDLRNRKNQKLQKRNHLCSRTKFCFSSVRKSTVAEELAVKVTNALTPAVTEEPTLWKLRSRYLLQIIFWDICKLGRYKIFHYESEFTIWKSVQIVKFLVRLSLDICENNWHNKCLILSHEQKWNLFYLATHIGPEIATRPLYKAK